jgi:hypothetical protein
MRASLNILTFALLVSVVAPQAATTQEIDASLYRDLEYRFAAIFPDTPQSREISYLTKDGASLSAQQFYVEQGTNQYLVTVVALPAGPAIDYYAVEHVANQMRLKGKVRFEYDDAYDPGIPGRQLNILQPDGRQLRVSTYMWDHNLYIAEAIAAPGDMAALKLEQSLLLLNAEGNALDTGSGNCPIAPPD